MSKLQQGYITQQSGSWLGHYSRWVLDVGSGQKKRQQRAFKLGVISAMNKIQARAALRA